MSRNSHIVVAMQGSMGSLGGIGAGFVLHGAGFPGDRCGLPGRV